MSGTITCDYHPLHNLHRPPPSPPPPSFSRQVHFPLNNPPHLRSSLPKGGKSLFITRIKASISAWDEKPYEIISGGQRSYFDEQDVVSFLDPPKELVPLDPASYNPASYLWKKIDDIPEERRYRLLQLLNPRLISRAWEVAGTRYSDAKLAKRSASKLLSGEDVESVLEYYSCRTSEGPWPVTWFNSFKKAIFRGNNGNTYGRFFAGSILSKFANSFSPLYFTIRETTEVMSTEQPCDLAYEFGNGLLDLYQYPPGFPTAAKHPHPFDDQVVIYIRHIGPDVIVGQAWQEGKDLQQVPKKLGGEILMVKDLFLPRELE